MTVSELIEACDLQAVNLGDPAVEISGVYSCDLLSIVMSKAFAGCAWITVMGNMNAVAVASLAEIGVIVLADGAKPDPNAIKKAEENGVNILVSDRPVFDTALAIHKALD